MINSGLVTQTFMEVHVATFVIQIVHTFNFTVLSHSVEYIIAYVIITAFKVKIARNQVQVTWMTLYKALQISKNVTYFNSIISICSSDKENTHMLP